MSYYKRDPIPSFKKGDFVVPDIVPFRGGVHGYRPATQEERVAWYADPAHKGMRDDGETHVFCGVTSIELPEGTQMIVIKARHQTRTGWEETGNMALVRVVETNEELAVFRRHLKILGA